MSKHTQLIDEKLAFCHKCEYMHRMLNKFQKFTGS